MMQVVCECGRIAEVRRRSNGQKLRYKVCICGTSLGGVEAAKLLEQNEREDIGVYGEFYKPGAPAEPAENSNSDQIDWVPDSETMPESEEGKADKKTDENSENSKSGGVLLRFIGWGSLALGLVGVGLGVKRSINSKGGAA